MDNSLDAVKLMLNMGNFKCIQILLVNPNPNISSI